MRGQYASSPLAWHVHACVARFCLGKCLPTRRLQAMVRAALGSAAWRAVVVLSLLLGHVGLRAETRVTGVLAADARWSSAYSPYRVEGDLLIRNGATLTIEPGVTVYMDKAANVRVEAGAIVAIGRSDLPIQVLSDKVRLGSTPAAGDWGQWQFMPGTGRTRLEWVQFQHGSGLSVSGSAPVFNQLSFKSHLGAAISVDAQASPSGVGLSAVDCGINGIAVESGDVTGTVNWGLRGIPYVVMGRLSVGQSPKVTAVSPSTVEQGQTVSLVLTGSRLQGLKSVEASSPGLALTPFSGGTSSTQTFSLKVASDAGLGAASLRMLVEAGELTVPNAFQVTPPMPQITELLPSSVVALSGLTQLQLKGRNFSAASQVLVNDVGLPTTYLPASNQLQATLPEQLNAGNLSVQVRNPAAVEGGAPRLSGVQTLPVKAPIPLTLAMEPNPVALPPDANKWKDLVIRLSRKDVADRVLSLTVQDPGRAKLAASSVTIPAGQTSAKVSLLALMAGTTQLQISSEGLTALNVPVFITTDYAGVGVGFARLVGVTVPKTLPPVPAPRVTTGAASVGVSSGATLLSVAPQGMTVGTSQTFTLSGQAIPADAQLSLQPSTGVAVDQLLVAPGGQSLSFRVTADAAAAMGPRRVLVRSASGQPFSFAQAAAGSIWLAQGLPRLDSVTPQFLVAGKKTRVQVRGAYLHGTSLNLDRSAGVSLDAQPVISAQGDLIELDVVVDATAELGRRRLQASNRVGSSKTDPDLGNSFYVQADAGVTIAPVVSPLVRVVAGTAVAPVKQQLSMAAQQVTVLNGAGVRSMSPRTGAVDSLVMLTVRGHGLAGVSSVVMQPAAGLSLGEKTVNEDGTELRILLTIAANAPLEPRKLVLKLANGLPLAASQFDGLTFRVTMPTPILESVNPQYLVRGSTAAMTLRGRNLTNVESVRVLPDTGITVNAPFDAAADGRSLRFTLTVDAAAPAVDRLLVVKTAAGESASEPGPANQVHVLPGPSVEIAPIVSPVVKVQMGKGYQPPGPPTTGTLSAPVVGLNVVEPVQPPLPVRAQLHGRAVSVVSGGVATGMEQAAWLQDSNGELVILGQGLDKVTAVNVLPADGVLLGAPVLEAGGTRLRLPLTIAVNAPNTDRQIRLQTASGPLSWAQPSAGRLEIGQMPTLASTSPIVWSRGAVFDVKLRGSKLKGVKSVAVLPSDGVEVDPALNWNSDASGEFLTIKVRVDAGAPLGDRVLQLRVPGGATSAEPAANNRITISN